MRVAIRTTCGRAIGFGHLRRCLTLGEELQRRGHEPIFWITGDDSGVELTRRAGLTAQSIDAGVDAILGRIAATAPAWLVVDDYALDGEELAALHRSTKLAVIDDLADRPLDADLVVNGNANADSLEYRTSARCTRLLGPSHSLLRPAFRERPRRTAAPEVRHALVILGGSDARGLTARVTRRLLAVCADAAVDVVVGPLAAPTPELADVVAGGRARVHRAPDDLLSLMERADLAVSAGGQTNYELAAVGVPAVSICVADNQRGNIEALAAVPTLLALFADDDATLDEAIARLARSRDLRQKMIDGGQRLVDGRGVSRVADAMESWRG